MARGGVAADRRSDKRAEKRPDKRSGAMRATRPVSGVREADGIPTSSSAFQAQHQAEIEALLFGTIVQPPALGFSLSSIPVVALDDDDLDELTLDRRTSALLDAIDGRSNLESIIARTDMTDSEAMGAVEALIALGAIRLLPPSGQETKRPRDGASALSAQRSTRR